MAKRKKKDKHTRAFMLRRGRNGSYCLRVRIRRAPNLSPERIERGLSTRDGREAWFRARVLLRMLADIGILAGWSGEAFIVGGASKQRAPQKNACHGSNNELKQGTFPFFDA